MYLTGPFPCRPINVTPSQRCHSNSHSRPSMTATVSWCQKACPRRIITTLHISPSVLQQGWPRLWAQKIYYPFSLFPIVLSMHSPPHYKLMCPHTSYQCDRRYILIYVFPVHHCECIIFVLVPIIYLSHCYSPWDLYMCFPFGTGRGWGGLYS